MIQISNDLREYSKLAEEVKAVAELYQRTLIIPQVRLGYQGKAIKIEEKFMAFTIDDLTNIAEGLYVAGKISEFNEQAIQRKPHYKELCDILLDRLYNIIIKTNKGIAA